MTYIKGHESIQPTDVHRILIRATNWVGDMVMTLPAIEAVRDIFPNAFIAVLAKPWVAPLVEHNPAVDEVIPLRKDGGVLRDSIEIIRISRMIRKMQFDLALLFQNAFEAALIAYFSGIKYRVGYNTDGRWFLLSHSIIKDNQTRASHQVEHYLGILRPLGWDGQTKDPTLCLYEKDIESTHSLLLSNAIQADDLVIGLSPGAIFGPAKRWPSERFAVIGDRALERWGAKIVLMGSHSEKEICKEVSKSMNNKPLDLCGQTTLGEAMAVIKRCRIFVTNDSGLMHVAAALDVPTVAIFGSTDHVATGPKSQKARVVRLDLDCAPCLKRQCPTHYRCMLEIQPDDVWKEMKTLKEMAQ